MDWAIPGGWRCPQEESDYQLCSPAEVALSDPWRERALGVRQYPSGLVGHVG